MKFYYIYTVSYLYRIYKNKKKINCILEYCTIIDIRNIDFSSHFSKAVHSSSERKSKKKEHRSFAVRVVQFINCDFFRRYF